MYRYADRSAAALAKLYLRYFRRVSDDEDLLELLLMLQAIYRDSYKALRDALLLTARKTYASVSRQIRKEANKLNPNEADETLIEILKRLKPEDPFEEDEIDYLFIDTLLNRVDPVLKYAIRPEIERRRAKVYEAMTVTEDRREEAKKAATELFRISVQALDNATDEANKKAMIDRGVRFVRWNAILDRRTCAECRALDGNVYEITSVPNKPHPRCRCFLEPVLKGDIK